MSKPDEGGNKLQISPLTVTLVTVTFWLYSHFWLFPYQSPGKLVQAFLSDWAESHDGGSGVVSGTFISGTGPIGQGLGKKWAGNLNFSRFHPFFEASFFGRFWMFL